MKRTTLEIATAIALGDTKALAELEKMTGKPIEEMTDTEKKIGLCTLAAFDGLW